MSLICFVQLVHIYVRADVNLFTHLLLPLFLHNTQNVPQRMADEKKNVFVFGACLSLDKVV